ncbi:MAG: hypothetical protein BWK73_04875, partial [Thiothrix lacustris]
MADVLVIFGGLMVFVGIYGLLKPGELKFPSRKPALIISLLGFFIAFPSIDSINGFPPLLGVVSILALFILSIGLIKSKWMGFENRKQVLTRMGLVFALAVLALVVTDDPKLPPPESNWAIWSVWGLSILILFGWIGKYIEKPEPATTPHVIDNLKILNSPDGSDEMPELPKAIEPKPSNIIDTKAKKITINFDYADADGVLTNRNVTIRVLGETYLEGFCHLRNEVRTFRRDRILTGEYSMIGSNPHEEIQMQYHTYQDVYSLKKEWLESLGWA